MSNQPSSAVLSDSPRVNLGLVLLIWVLIAGLYIGRAWFNADHVPLFADTDDAMRLVTVRDFLAGQGWYDHWQARLNVPTGAEMHWSRLVDLVMGGLVLLFRPFVDNGTAEILAAYAWPLGLLFIMLVMSARLTLRLVGNEGVLPALILPVLTPAVMAEFVPGRFDHHSVQIILTLVMAWCTIEALDRPRFAIGAGLAAATGLAIGAEAVPMVAATVLAFGLIWVFRPERAGALRAFGLSFGIGTVLHLMIAWPPNRWFEPACDTISFVYASAALGTGIALTLLSVLPLRTMLMRLAVGGVLGAVTLGAVVAAFPHCLAANHAGLDPWLIDMWAKRIVETKTLWQIAGEFPGLMVAIAVPLAIAVAVVLYKVTRAGDGRDRWLVHVLFLAILVLLTIIVVRGARMAGIVAIPAGAWLIVAARTRYLATRSIAAAGGLVGSWLAFAGIIFAAGITAILPMMGPSGISAGGGTEAATAAADHAACLMPSAFAELAALPPERIMAPIDLGAHILAFTPHSVVAAPYPKNFQPNVEGIRDAMLFFNGPLADVRQILTERGIGLVVTCPALVEMQVGPGTNPASFIALEAAGALPDWLVDRSLPGAPLKVFAVLPE